MSEDCKDCPYQLGNGGRITKLERDMDSVWNRLRFLENSTTSQAENTKVIFEILGELKQSIKNIEQAVYNREDPFKKAMFDIGMWSIKVLVGGGALVWAAYKFK